MKKFKNYKEKQRYYEDRSNRIVSRYDSGKRTTRKGEVRIKGIPFVNEEKRRLKEERKLKRKGSY